MLGQSELLHDFAATRPRVVVRRREHQIALKRTHLGLEIPLGLSLAGLSHQVAGMPPDLSGMDQENNTDSERHPREQENQKPVVDLSCHRGPG